MCLHMMKVTTSWFMATQKICQRDDKSGFHGYFIEHPLQGRKRDISDSAITFFSTHGFHVRNQLSCGLSVTRGLHKKTDRLVTSSSGTIQQSPIPVQDCHHQSHADLLFVDAPTQPC